MKTAITKSIFTILIFCLISCGEKKEEQKESFDENTYNGFDGVPFLVETF